mmetsp:Transcript_24505/g.27424  ORF Transcript_24505/g.27424 Transcript_24505/m.27424 type:complete len:243 (+) Transcript_24505:194-922(+)
MTFISIPSRVIQIVLFVSVAMQHSIDLAAHGDTLYDKQQMDTYGTHLDELKQESTSKESDKLKNRFDDSQLIHQVVQLDEESKDSLSHNHDHHGHGRNAAEEGHLCGTLSPSKEEKEFDKLALRDWKAANGAANGFSRQLPTRSYTVQTWLHFIVKDNTSTGGSFTTEEVETWIGTLNDYFTGKGLQFELAGTTTTIDSAGYTCSGFTSITDIREQTYKEGSDDTLNIKGGSDTLNIWTCDL